MELRFHALTTVKTVWQFGDIYTYHFYTSS